MPNVPVDKIATVGLVTDLPGHSLPPEVWTNGNNVRFVERRAERVGGWGSVMGTPSAAPAFVMNVDDAGDSYWIYASAIGVGSTVHAFNSGNHGDISQAGNYTVTNAHAWNGTVFQGIPILNYGGGVPQYWSSLSLAQALQDVPNWPANTTAAVIRAFKNFLVALNITDSGGNHIHRALWSDGAAPGSMPTSWDVTDNTVEANHRDLSDVNSGAIQDGMALQDFFVIYKKQSTWLMRYIGGQFIMATKQQLQGSGLLAARCVRPVTPPNSQSQVHFLHNGKELGTFDGQVFRSVVDSRIRRKVESSIDPIYFRNSYIVDNPLEQEAIFVYPENGEVSPNIAAVWNYGNNTCYLRDFTGTHAATGVVESAAATTWVGVIGSWSDQGVSKWQEASREKVIIADRVGTKLLQLDAENTHDGTGFAARIIRRGLAVVGTDRQGEPIVDQRSRKLLSRVWIKASGGKFNVRVGGEDGPPGDNDDESPITWLDSQEFDPSDNVGYLDFVINTRFIAVEFSSTSSDNEIWRLEGYSVDVEVISEH